MSPAILAPTFLMLCLAGLSLSGHAAAQSAPPAYTPMIADQIRASRDSARSSVFVAQQERQSSLTTAAAQQAAAAETQIAAQPVYAIEENADGGVLFTGRGPLFGGVLGSQDGSNGRPAVNNGTINLQLNIQNGQGNQGANSVSAGQIASTH